VVVVVVVVGIVIEQRSDETSIEVEEVEGFLVPVVVGECRKDFVVAVVGEGTGGGTGGEGLNPF